MDPNTEIAEGRRECAVNMALQYNMQEPAPIETVIANAGKIEAFLKGDTPAE